MRQDVGAWSLGMKARFPNLDDDCCIHGRALKPIRELNRAIYVIDAYRKVFEQIGDMEFAGPASKLARAVLRRSYF